MLIRGENLTPEQVRKVKDAFGYRWTVDNNRREYFWRNVSGRPTIPLETDADWIASHAFHFVSDGSRLMLNRHHAEPAYMADVAERSR